MSSVFEILRARRDRGSRAPHGDGASVALAVEGGAMRGVISAGMVSALEELGFTDAFDAVYGSSAGAINAAYFLAGQARLGTTVYYEDINSRAFISLRRAVVGRPIVDLGFLLDEVAVARKTLDVGRVLASASPLSVLATDIESGTADALRDFRSGAELLQALRAGATMPVVAGPPREVRGPGLVTVVGVGRAGEVPVDVGMDVPRDPAARGAGAARTGPLGPAGEALAEPPGGGLLAHPRGAVEEERRAEPVARDGGLERRQQGSVTVEAEGLAHDAATARRTRASARRSGHIMNRSTASSIPRPAAEPRSPGGEESANGPKRPQRSLSHWIGSTARPSCRISKWSRGPARLPDSPTVPTIAPLGTRWPTPATARSRWA